MQCSCLSSRFSQFFTIIATAAAPVHLEYVNFRDMTIPSVYSHAPIDSEYWIEIISITCHRRLNDDPNVCYYDQPSQKNLVTISLALKDRNNALVTGKSVPLEVGITTTQYTRTAPPKNDKDDIKLIRGKDINASGTCDVVCQFGRAMNNAMIYVMFANNFSVHCAVGPFTIKSKKVEEYMYKTTFTPNNNNVMTMVVDANPSFSPSTKARQSKWRKDFDKLLRAFSDRIAQLKHNNTWNESNDIRLGRFARDGEFLLSHLEAELSVSSPNNLPTRINNAAALSTPPAHFYTPSKHALMENDDSFELCIQRMTSDSESDEDHIAEPSLVNIESTDASTGSHSDNNDSFAAVAGTVNYIATSEHTFTCRDINALSELNVNQSKKSRN